MILMAASVIIEEMNGDSGSPTPSTATNMNFGSADEANIVVADHPITCGTNSFSKWYRLHITDMGTPASNLLNNIKIWKDSGVYKTDEVINFKNTDTYVTPSATTVGGTAAIPTSAPATNVTGELDADEEYSYYMMLQLSTSASTEAGSANQKVIKVSYDEQ